MGSNIIVSGPKPMAQDVKIVEFPGAQLLITRRETLSPSRSGTRIVPEKWFAASCEVMTEAFLISLLITI